MNAEVDGGLMRDDRAVANWLYAVAALVGLMVVVGGVTRLTESGLSMVEWRPLIGALPPLTEQDWVRVFEMYKKTPEYDAVNFWMGIEDFKEIFFWEYSHRLLGRLIGFAFAVPFIYYLIKGKIDKTLLPRLILMFFVGGLQGAIGWWMVSSGLVDRPDVSQYRLATHLGVAFVILALILWTAFDLSTEKAAGNSSQGIRRLAVAVFSLISVTIIAGAFVAGTDAGFAYNDFPFMDGKIIPEAYGEMSPYYLNWFENLAAIQFNHRLLAVITALSAIWLWWLGRREAVDERSAKALNILFVVVVLQFLLGVSALMMYVPISIGAAHQGGAVVLFVSSLWVVHCLKNRSG